MKASLFNTLIKGLLIPICGILLTNCFNLFSYISFVPQDYVFKAGITSYFLILEFLFTIIQERIEKSWATDIKCVFFTDDETKSLANTPIISFPTVDVVYLRCEVSLKGSQKRIKNLLVKISLPEWVEAQESSRNFSLSIGSANDCFIDLSKLINADYDNNNTSHAAYKIPLIRNTVDEKCSINISPKISSKSKFHINFFLKFTHNSVTLKN